MKNENVKSQRSSSAMRDNIAGNFATVPLTEVGYVPCAYRRGAAPRLTSLAPTLHYTSK